MWSLWKKLFCRKDKYVDEMWKNKKKSDIIEKSVNSLKYY